MNDRSPIYRLFALSCLVLAILGIAAVLIDRAGLEARFSLMASVATILSLALAITIWMDKSNSDDTSATPETLDMQTVIPSTHLTGETPSPEEYAEMMKKSPEWRPGGKRKFPNKTVRVARDVQRVLDFLSVSKRWRQWAYRIAMGVAALAYLWLLILFGRFLEEAPLIELPATLQSIIYAIPTPAPFSPLVNLLLYFGVPLFILITVLWFGTSKPLSTCQKCKKPFALENDGCYYKSGDRTSQSETRNGEEYSWVEVDGMQILHCTYQGCDDCDKYYFRRVPWTESDGFLDF